MATSQKSVSKKQVEAAARKRYGNQIRLVENPRAVTAERRAEAVARFREVCDALRLLDESEDAIRAEWRNLIRAARFALDVEGDEPSWGQLADAVAASEALDAKLDERKKLRQEKDRLQVLLIYHRWEAREDLGGGTRTCAAADTLPELLAKIEGR